METTVRRSDRSIQVAKLQVKINDLIVVGSDHNSEEIWQCKWSEEVNNYT